MKVSLSCIIVDDSLFVQNLLEDIIKEAGHTVISFSSGSELIENIVDINPHLIFLDIILPDISSFDILKEINTLNPSSKVIMLSGLSKNEAISASMRAGAVDFLRKPFDRDEVLDLIDKISDTFVSPGIEKLSIVGLSCLLISAFFRELLNYNSPPVKKMIKIQMKSVFERYQLSAQGILIFNVNDFTLKPDQKMWGTIDEQEVLKLITSIPQSLESELKLIYSDDIVNSIYNDAIITISSKKRFSHLVEDIDLPKIGLPKAIFSENNVHLLSNTGTTVEELENSIFISVIHLDEYGPEIISTIGNDLFDETDLLRNGVFYFTLLGFDKSFIEGLYGPMPVTTSTDLSVSSLVYSLEKYSEELGEDEVILLCIYYLDAADKIVSDYNKLSFLIRTRMIAVNSTEEIDKNVLKNLQEDLIDYLLKG